MLSDDSSSDSETGRFKGRSKPDNEQGKKHKDDNIRSLDKNKHFESNRHHRDFHRRRDERTYISKDSRDRDRHRNFRPSPTRRRNHSRERSPRRRPHESRHSRDRRSQEKHKLRTESRTNSKSRELRTNSKSKEYRTNSKSREYRSTSKDGHQHSPSRSKRKDQVDEKIHSKKLTKSARDSISLSPNDRDKRSEVFKAPPSLKRKSKSPIVLEENSDTDDLEQVQPGSYYNMIPTVVKEISEESSEIDSSDDEKLRAKLLNLEKKLHKTKKKKRRKKHKRRSSKSKEIEPDPALVEVTSTTDIENKSKTDITIQPEAAAEVTSTQKSLQKESSEEGEITSDDDSKKEIDIDPNDLRHKLKRSKQKSASQEKDVCGPILPPHLSGQERSTSPRVEGPALPPHLQRRLENIGPVIPDDMRRALAENDYREIIKYEFSDDEDIGPLPAGSEDKWSDAHKKLEVRALNMKIRQLDGHSLHSHQVKSREQWMLELPEGKAKYIGLEARSFRAKEGPDMSDRSSWTDTPEDKARKATGLVKQEDADVILKREANARHITNRDKEQEEAVKKHKKKHKREDSLLDLHQKKLKKKKKKDDKDEEKKERRPFSRDVDLQVNRFDEAQKKSVIKKAQNLDGRFSSGEAKFL